jgi:hypothetical protein
MATKRKLTVNLTEDVLDLLRDLAERNGSSMTEELKKAIADRKYFADKIDAGNEIVLERPVVGASAPIRVYVDLR